MSAFVSHLAAIVTPQMRLFYIIIAGILAFDGAPSPTTRSISSPIASA